MNNVGLSLPNRGVLFGATTMDELYALAERAESSGLFHSLWVGDGLIAKPRLEAITTLSALAGRTQRLVLGVCCMATFPLRNPVLFACQWASLDVISNGRSLLAVCLGAPTGRGGSNFARRAQRDERRRALTRASHGRSDRRRAQGVVGAGRARGRVLELPRGRSRAEARAGAMSAVDREQSGSREAVARALSGRRRSCRAGWRTVGSAPLSLPRTSAVALVRFERRWNRSAASRRCRPRALDGEPAE